MSNIAWRAALAALTLVAAGCSNPRPWSCNNEARHACSEWSGANASKQTGCTQMGGIFAHAPCPTANAIGICTPRAPEAGNSDSKLVFYAPRTASEAEQACTRAMGNWSVSLWSR